MDKQNNLAIEFDGFTFIYGNNNSVRPAVKDISFELERGKTLILAGGSGSGKSTICNALNGIIPFRQIGFMKGDVKVLGLSVWEQSLAQLSKQVGLVKQNPDEQLVTFTVRDEISFGLENLNLPKEEIIERVDDIVGFMNIEHLINRDIDDLSGGEKQIVVICSYLVMKPKILILDEPFAFLDQKSSTLLLNRLKKLYQNKELDLSLIIVEHRLSKVLDIADYLLVLNYDGEIALKGSINDLFRNHFNDLKFCNLRIPWIPDLFISALETPKREIPLFFDTAIKMINNETNKNLELLKKKLYENFMNHRDHSEGMENEILLEFKDISFKYPNLNRMALNNISLKIFKGDFIGLVGHNGCGKTTLLYLIAGLYNPSKGLVYYKGKNLLEIDFYEYAEKIGFIFQNPENMLFKNTIRDEILYAPRNFNIQNQIAQDNLNQLMRMVGNVEVDRNPFNLSWGQKRRLNLSSIFIYDPEIILLDEPFIGQDQKTIDELITILYQEQQKGKTIIIASHDYHLLLNHVDKIIELDNGNLIEYEENYSYFQKYQSLGPISLLNIINKKLGKI